MTKADNVARLRWKWKTKTGLQRWDFELFKEARRDVMFCDAFDWSRPIRDRTNHGTILTGKTVYRHLDWGQIITTTVRYYGTICTMVSWFVTVIWPHLLYRELWNTPIPYQHHIVLHFSSRAFIFYYSIIMICSLPNISVIQNKPEG